MNEIIDYAKITNKVNNILDNINNIKKINQNDFYEMIYYNEYIKQHINEFSNENIIVNLKAIQQKLEAIISLINDDQIITNPSPLEDEKFNIINTTKPNILSIFIKKTWVSILLTIILLIVHLNIYSELNNILINDNQTIFKWIISFCLFIFTKKIRATVYNSDNIKEKLIISSVLNFSFALLSLKYSSILYFAIIAISREVINILYNLFSYCIYFVKCIFYQYFKKIQINDICYLKMEATLHSQQTVNLINHQILQNIIYKPFEKEYIDSLYDSVVETKINTKNNKLDIIERMANNIQSEYNIYQYNKNIQSEINQIIDKKYDSLKEKIINYVNIELMYDNFDENEKRHAVCPIDFIE